MSPAAKAALPAGSGGAVQSQCDMNSYGSREQSRRSAVEYAACGDGSATLYESSEDVPRPQLSVQINPNEKRVRERFHVDLRKETACTRRA